MWLQRARRIRYPLLVAWGIVWLLPPNAYSLRLPNDWLMFEIGARTIVHYHHMWAFSEPALHLFADTPMLQFGPPPVLLLAAFQGFSPHSVAIGFGIAMIVAGIASMRMLEVTALTLVPAPAHRRARRVSLALQVVLVPLWSYEVGYWHHLDDVLALLCISGALLVIARSGSWWVFGLLVGTAAAIKPWAIIAAPLLLALPRPHWAKATLATMAACAAWWAPFVVAAPHTISALGQFHMPASGGSVLHLLDIRADNSNWLRPLQLGAGMLGVGLLARRGRWQDALLAGIAVRILLDPYAYSYYVMGAMLASVLMDLNRVERTRVPRWTIASVALVWLPARLAITTPFWDGIKYHAMHIDGVVGATRLVWAVVVLAVLMRPLFATAGLHLRPREVPAATA